MNKRTWKTDVFWSVLIEAVGGLSGWLTREIARIYSAAIEQPPQSPPQNFCCKPGQTAGNQNN